MNLAEKSKQHFDTIGAIEQGERKRTAGELSKADELQVGSDYPEE
jgi:hypothetical protein